RTDERAGGVILTSPGRRARGELGGAGQGRDAWEGADNLASADLREPVLLRTGAAQPRQPAVTQAVRPIGRPDGVEESLERREPAKQDVPGGLVAGRAELLRVAAAVGVGEGLDLADVQPSAGDRREAVGLKVRDLTSDRAGDDSPVDEVGGVVGAGGNRPKQS